ncbi:MAG: ATP synthase F0 subunit B [Acidobacteria bacterium]|nr:ATP synthase F0 subunit B [Acidobacteriota bacterium]
MRFQTTCWFNAATGAGVLAAMLCGGPRLMAAGPEIAPRLGPMPPLAALAAPAQEEAAESEHAAAEHPEGEAEEHSLMEEIFHWFNFLLLVGGLGYLVKKLLIPFLEERGKQIRQDMDRSAKALADADQRLATVEEKLKSMDEEMASLRQAAFRESAAERERIEQSASSDASKILSTAEQEIEAAVKAARQELKLYTSELALGMAEKKLRDSLTPSSDERILRAFVRELAASPGSGNGEARNLSPNAAPPAKQE